MFGNDPVLEELYMRTLESDNPPIQHPDEETMEQNALANINELVGFIKRLYAPASVHNSPPARISILRREIFDPLYENGEGGVAAYIPEADRIVLREGLAGMVLTAGFHEAGEREMHKEPGRLLANMLGRSFNDDYLMGEEAAEAAHIVAVHYQIFLTERAEMATDMDSIMRKNTQTAIANMPDTPKGFPEEYLEVKNERDFNLLLGKYRAGHAYKPASQS